MSIIEKIKKSTYGTAILGAIFAPFIIIGYKIGLKPPEPVKTEIVEKTSQRPPVAIQPDLSNYVSKEIYQELADHDTQMDLQVADDQVKIQSLKEEINKLKEVANAPIPQPKPEVPKKDPETQALRDQVASLQKELTNARNDATIVPNTTDRKQSIPICKAEPKTEISLGNPHFKSKNRMKVKPYN